MYESFIYPSSRVPSHSSISNRWNSELDYENIWWDSVINLLVFFERQKTDSKVE